jgi:hypothetical protein
MVALVGAVDVIRMVTVVVVISGINGDDNVVVRRWNYLSGWILQRQVVVARVVRACSGNTSATTSAAPI